MMVFGVGITSDDVRPVGSSPADRSLRNRVQRQCLILTGDPSLRRRLQSVAELGGWEACEAPADGDAVAAAIDRDFQFVVVDIAQPLGERVSDSVEIAEEFAGRSGCTLVIVGSEDSVEEELWARQLGVCAYLPGVSSGDALLMLFSDARRLAERREFAGCV